MMGEPDDLWLLSTDDGYGFVARFEELMTDRKAGKTIVNVNDGATLLRPQRVSNFASDRIAAATTEGKLLLFASERAAAARARQGRADDQDPSHADRAGEGRQHRGGPAEGTLVVHAGKRYTNLKGADLESYIGKRAQRGLKLPRGFQNVSVDPSSWTEREPRPDNGLVM